MTLTTAAPIAQLILDTATAVLPSAATDPVHGVEVLDSISERQGEADRSVTVGGTWDPDAQSFTSDQTITTSVETRGAGRLTVETTNVACIAWASSGDLDFAARRAEVQATLTALGDALRDIHELAGVSVQLEITAQQWAHVQNGQGAGAMCMFTVTATALP